ncbi:hypothetical protein H8F24_09305 [Synechococcus sp. CBW1002]|uniref:hypothetical protein n=1 Tax=unclassified Synechococcus TaxID=2626047 RepID=UPI0018CD1004|nr:MULTISPECIES: hypothetical protein [unclassified Synechococcus]QPN58444.1 hypothetical protein H8F24_09305 [Synechococcus sp. CBW1002]QPN68056.1 hypothetical protein H8F26_08225 [Synechococcus sp. CBW1006]
MNLSSKLAALIQEHPSLSYGELHDMLCDQGWALEPLTVEEHKLANQVPGWKALIILCVNAQLSERKAQSFPQLIPTGETLCRDKLVSSVVIAKMLSLYEDQILIRGDGPLCLAGYVSDPSLQLSQALIDIAKSVVADLAHSSLLIDQSLLGESMVLLMNRCLLRRTYPCYEISQSSKNKNNQDWHQDSSLVYGGRPMLTLWIPLQEYSGQKIPGIELASLRSGYFSSHFGDGIENLADVSKDFPDETVSTVIPRLNAGGYAVFNGLTYHRTYANNGMSSARDALLIRIAPRSHAGYFPGDRSNDIEFRL